MPNSWSNQAYVQVFDCESITFKAFFYMFEHMEIVESIYELVLETSYKNPTSAYSTRADHNRLKKVEVALSNT